MRAALHTQHRSVSPQQFVSIRNKGGGGYVWRCVGGEYYNLQWNGDPRRLLLSEGWSLQHQATAMKRQRWCQQQMSYHFKWCHSFLNGLAFLVMAAGVMAVAVWENSFAVAGLTAFGAVVKG